ncbi:PCF11 protein, partial [Atractosteus spatula]|nr:PCF11 protein [Atractosteus spatula]
MMTDDAAREDACREYQSSLEDLTFNSKPHINMLTILAEENLHFAKDIVAIIEAQIAKAPPSEKLPVLYLVDSIVKNVGREYLATFTKNLVHTFICVFEKVDENTRKSLFKLRSTWEEIFPLKKLYALDVRVNSLDPAWPIRPLPPNVNSSSIHVNPRFLKPNEEIPPRASTPQVAPHPVVNEKNLTQEQIIRQQLLAKQKQLIELQQKKLELELEQTKAQLAANQLGSIKSQVSAPSQPQPPAVSKGPPPVAAPSDKSWLPPQQDIRVSTRDPRLNRAGQQSTPVKEKVPNTKESYNLGTISNAPDKKANPSADKQSKTEKSKSLKKETVVEDKPKSKSPSPLKAFQSKSKCSDLDSVKGPDLNKRDPRLRKHLHDKADVKEDEIKEKKKGVEKKEREDSSKASEHRSSSTKNKLANGAVNKHERNETSDKQDPKLSKSNARKRSRSRSRSPLLHSPKRKDRRSPKRRTRSISSSPPKSGKGRQSGGRHSHTDDFTNARDERSIPKKNTGDPRRPKRSLEDRSVESRDSPRLPLELKENPKRWRSGWEENKHMKQNEENLAHGKPGPQRHKTPWPGNQRIPRLSKQHRLSVDANLQIPEVLNSASKRDLLKKASKRHADGEISQEEFLCVAHQIKQLFQYQEEKQRSDSWEGNSEDGQYGSKKKPLLSTPPSQHANMSDAEISYYEHKAKLRRTQVQHQGNDVWDADESQEENYSNAETHVKECEASKGHPGPRIGDGQFRKRSPFTKGSRHPSSLTGSRFRGHNKQLSQNGKEKLEEHDTLVEITKELSSNKREVPRQRGRPGQDYIKTDDLREYSGTDERLKFKTEGGREHHSPYSDRQQPLRPSYDGNEKESLGAAQRRFGGTAEGPKFEESANHPCSRVDESSKNDRLSIKSGPSFNNSPGHPDQSISVDGPSGKSPVPVFDGPPSSELESQQLPRHEANPSQRFEATSTGDGLVTLPENDDHLSHDVTSRRDVHPGKERIGSKGQMLCESPGHTPPPVADGPLRFEGQLVPHRFDGPQGPQPLMMFDGPSGHLGQPRYDAPTRQHAQGRFDVNLGQQGPGRFDGPPGHLGSRFDGQHQQGPGRYDGPQGPGRFEGPPVQQAPVRFEGPGRFDGPSMQPGPVRFEEPQGQQGPGRFDGPHQQGVGRFDGPLGQQGPGRFDGQGPGRFDGPQMHHGPGRFDSPMRFDGPHMQQGPGRFEGPMRFGGPQQGPGRFDVPSGQQGPMRFESPVGQQGPMRFEGPQGQLGPGRFEGQSVQPGMTRFDCPPGQQGHPRFCGPQNQLRPQVPPIFDAPQGQGPLQFDGQGNPQPSNFNMPNLRFGEPVGMFGSTPQQFQGQQNMPQGSNFNGQPGAGPSGFANSYCQSAAPFYNAGATVGNMNTSVPAGTIIPQQPMNILPALAKNQPPAPYTQGQPYIPPSQNAVPFNQPGSQFTPPESHFGQVDVNDLLSKLISTGIIKPTQTETPPSETAVPPQSQSAVEEEEEEEQDDDQNVPDLTGFMIEDMKQRYDSVINRLYTGIQCYSCGMRFTASQTDVYADHLDWHYRQNRSEKDISKKVTHRRWYYSLTDWIEFEEIADLEERAKSQFFEKVHEEVVQKTQEAAKEKEFQSVKAAPDVVHESCEICQEQFEMYWEEEEEEWHLKNAIRVEGKTYHPSCYEDYKNTSSFVDCTPSPSKAPVENPLNKLIKKEIEDPSTCTSVKEEPDIQSSCTEENVKEEVHIKSEAETQDASAIIF